MDVAEKGDGSVESAFADFSEFTKNGENETMPYLVAVRLGQVWSHHVAISIKTPGGCHVDLGSRQTTKT